MPNFVCKILCVFVHIHMSNNNPIRKGRFGEYTYTIYRTRLNYIVHKLAEYTVNRGP